MLRERVVGGSMVRTATMVLTSHSLLCSPSSPLPPAQFVWPSMIKSGQEHGVCITDCLWEEHLLRVKAKASTTTMATLPRRCTHPVMTQWRQQSGVVV